MYKRLAMRVFYLLLFLAFGSVSYAQTDSASKELQSDIIFLKSEVYKLQSNINRLEENMHLASQYILARNISAGVSTGFVVMILSNKFTLKAMKAFVVVSGVSGAIAIVLGVKAYLILHRLHTEEYST